MPPKRMHQQERLLEDLRDMHKFLAEDGGVPGDVFTCGDDDNVCFACTRWATGYSTSPHLATMRQIVIGTGAKRIGEIGFGRSSFMFALLGYNEFDGRDTRYALTTCDRYDYRYMLDIAGIDWVDYIIGDADKFFSRVDTCDFLFLDYMSTRKKSVESCYKDMKRAIKMLPTNGIVAVHDALPGKYNVAAALKMLQAKYRDEIEALTLPYGYGLALIRRISASKHGILKDTWKKQPDDRSGDA